LKIFLVLATIFTITLTIISVELTLAYNSISGVYTIESTGQLIPLIIGIVGVGRTLNAITINCIKKVSRELPKDQIALAYAVLCK